MFLENQTQGECENATQEVKVRDPTRIHTGNLLAVKQDELDQFLNLLSSFFSVLPLPCAGQGFY